MGGVSQGFGARVNRSTSLSGGEFPRYFSRLFASLGTWLVRGLLQLIGDGAGEREDAFDIWEIGARRGEIVDWFPACNSDDGGWRPPFPYSRFGRGFGVRGSIEHGPGDLPSDSLEVCFVPSDYWARRGCPIFSLKQTDVAVSNRRRWRLWRSSFGTVVTRDGRRFRGGD